MSPKSVVPVGGFSAKEPPVWYERLYLSLFLPLRREFKHDWFQIVLRYGNVGGEESFYVPDPYDDTIRFPVKPTRGGELFIFVNDAVIGWPRLFHLFYRNNRGTAYLTVKRTR